MEQTLKRVSAPVRAPLLERLHTPAKPSSNIKPPSEPIVAAFDTWQLHGVFCSLAANWHGRHPAL